jgi:hypothetical protein
MSKKSTKNSCIVLNILYSHKVVSWENNIFCVLCKKTKFNAKIGVTRGMFFVFFTQDTKIVSFPHNLTCAHRILRCTCKIFVQIYFTFQKCFIRWWEHMLPCPKSFPIDKVVNIHILTIDAGINLIFIQPTTPSV